MVSGAKIVNFFEFKDKNRAKRAINFFDVFFLIFVMARFVLIYLFGDCTVLKNFYYFCVMKRYLVILFTLLLCNVVGLCVNADDSLSDVELDVKLSSESFISQQSRSCGIVLPETNSASVISVKVNQNNHHQLYTFFAHAGASHSLNAVIACRKSHIVGFSRSVDKYIYALRRIII